MKWDKKQVPREKLSLSSKSSEMRAFGSTLGVIQLFSRLWFPCCCSNCLQPEQWASADKRTVLPSEGFLIWHLLIIRIDHIIATMELINVLIQKHVIHDFVLLTLVLVPHKSNVNKSKVIFCLSLFFGVHFCFPLGQNRRFMSSLLWLHSNIKCYTTTKLWQKDSSN